jgi:hypothetical protein
LLIRGNRALVVVSLVVFGVVGLRLGVLLRMGEKLDRSRPNATMRNERLFIHVIFCPQLKKNWSVTESIFQQLLEPYRMRCNL